MRINQTYTRPYKINDKALEKIFIYKDNKIVVSAGYCFETPMSDNYTTTKDIFGVDIAEPKRANKIDLTRDYNFYIPKKNYFNETVYELYINAKDIEVLAETEFENEIEKGYKYIYKRYTIKNNVGNFEFCEGFKGEKPKETNTITIQVFDRIEKSKVYEEQQAFTRDINEKYSGRLYNFNNIKELYNELKDYFEKK